MGLLTAAFALIVATEASLVTNILLIVVAVVWLQLPLIEGTQYEAIREANRRPTSLYLHIGGTLLIMAYVAGYSGYDPALFLSEAQLLSPEIAYIRKEASQVIGSGGLLVLIVGTSIGYLSLLDNELQET
jgi:hypothetical protein